MYEKRTAVVVDDEPITCMDVAEMLREMGFDVVGEAADGFDAVELCRVHRPDLVLMDARMPVFDGLTASKTILEKHYCNCIVLLTAYQDRDMIEKATKAGALTASAVGVFFVVLYKFCGVQLPFSSVFPILPSLVAFVIVSLCTQPKDQVQKN